MDDELLKKLTDKIGAKRLELRSANAKTLDLVFSGELPEIHELDVSWSKSLTAALEALLKSKSLAELRSLNLCSTKLSSESVELLAKATHLTKLRQLNLSMNKIGGGPGIPALATAPHLAELQELDLSETDLKPSDIRAIARSRWRSIRALSLNDNSLTKDDVMALLDSEAFGELRRLEMVRCRLSTRALKALVMRLKNKTVFPKLKDLILQYNELPDWEVDRAGMSLASRRIRLHATYQGDD